MNQRKTIKKSPLILALAGSLIASTAAHSAAYHNVGAWFKTQYNKLVITTAAQNVFVGNCSGSVNIQTRNPFGTTKNVSSNLTVSLNGSASMTFYSDSP